MSTNHPRSLSRKISASLLSLLSSSRSPTPTPNATRSKDERSPTRSRTASRASQLSNLSTLSTKTNASVAKLAEQLRKVRNYRRRETIRPGFHPFNLPSSANSSVVALDSLSSPHDLSLCIATPTSHRSSRTPSDYPVRFPSSEWSAWSDLGDDEDWFARPPAPRMRSYSDDSLEARLGNKDYEEEDETRTEHGHVYEPEEYASFESLIDPSFSSFSSHTSRTSSHDISTSSIITFPSSASSHQTPQHIRKSVPPPKSEPTRPRSPIFARAQSRMTPGYVEVEDVFGGWHGVRWRRNSVEW